MTKDELKAGYLVELKNGERYVIMFYNEDKYTDFILIDETGHGYIPFTYDAYLHDTYPVSQTEKGAYDIEKVWGFPNTQFTLSELFDTSIRNLLWQREVKEMTLEEVCEVLGYEIKIVKKT